MRTFQLSMLALGTLGVAACATISDFDTWVQTDLQPTEHVAVFAPADAHAEARRLEQAYCEQLTEANRRVNCEPLTVQFPVGQQVSESRLQSALEATEATHLVTINLLQSTPRTSTHGTILGDFVWGHNNHYDNNLHQVQVLELNTQEIAYSAQLRSSSQLSLTQHSYITDVTRRIVRNQQQYGLIAGL
ncbi:MAG: hypothetical protein JJU03_11445 [Idiomarina sp.]|nr:hypothetical protein [Idiomarina sp.]